ncbi:tRNA adenosine(34) deaminase TadA [Blastopirellula retiformator]|uniref:tRNA-specific adenosine deaminase n=1 Tax=Blastopirellula retiformator TaxID=2527970 RepID=A0A5C5UZ56_9BACT|nr:tRNA adenosine(34) deaminase TadA [Blastopirellula retiformator]TWT30767.1 tRNA-specific adenosine deaminase [Blastopirellula retiformator]
MIDTVEPRPFEFPSFHQIFMHQALELAEQAAREKEVPVGAIIVHENKVIAAAYNQRETLHDPTAHAEMIAITQAAESLQNWRLENCTLYVTLEPCPMCAGAIVQARIPTVVFGAVDPKAGAVTSLYSLLSDTRLNHRCEVVPGVLSQQCGAVLTEFFRARRAEGKK